MTRDNLIVIGAHGMLGSDLVKLLCEQGRKFIPFDIPEIDVTNYDSVRSALSGLSPRFIINCAAYTNVEGAETERELAYKVNHIGPKNLAEFAAVAGTPLCHISTDYVFNGRKDGPYSEDDPTDPLNVYGASKLAGEEEVRKIGKFYIIRTAWLYGKNGRNFVTTIINAAQKQDELKVVDDQFGSPTYTVDLARRIMEVIDRNLPFGIYHATNVGVTSWYELAKLSIFYSGLQIRVKPISSDKYPGNVVRPRHSILSNEKAERAGLAPMPHWKDALKRFLSE